MFRPLLLILVVALVSACSLGRKMAYRMADGALLRSIDSHFALTDAQEDRVKEEVESLFSWHQKSELPRYATTFRRMADEAADGISVEEIDRYWKVGDEAYGTIVRKLALPAAEFLGSVSEQQISRMEDKAEERRRKRLERLKDEKVMAKSTEKNIERWVGDLNGTQQAITREYAKKMLPIQKRMMELNSERQKSFASLLRARPKQEELARQVELRLLDPQAAGESEYASLREQSQESYLFLMRTLLPSLEKRQLERVRKELRSWADDMDELAR